MKKNLLTKGFAIAFIAVTLIAGNVTKMNAQGYYGEYFKHLSTTTNSYWNYTYIDNPTLNNNANAIVLATPNYEPNAVYNNFHPCVAIASVGADFLWVVADEASSTSAIPDGSTYNVLIPTANGSSFQHTATLSNIGNNYTLIDNPAVNNQPNALVFITQYWGSPSVGGVWNNKAVGVWYSNGKWSVYNEDMTAMPDGAMFNGFIVNPSANAFIHTSTSSNITANWTAIDHPFLNGNPNATILITHNWKASPFYNTSPVGVFYNGSKWAIYNQDIMAMDDSLAFNVLIADLGVSVNDIAASKTITFGPNPATDNIIFSNTDNKPLDVQILDIAGKLLISKQVAGNVMDVSSLATGMYIMKINNNSYKLIKE